MNLDIFLIIKINTFRHRERGVAIQTLLKNWIASQGLAMTAIESY
jgi:hypothetical protein